MNMSIKDIINNATAEMEQAIETIKGLKELLNEPIDGTRPLTETEQLCIDIETTIERLQSVLIEPLREINTPIGILYIEDFLFRVEDQRIKIYDSNKEYMDYISMDTIMDWSEEHHCSCVTILEEYIKYLEKCSTVEKLFEGLGVKYIEYSVEWKVVADKLVEDSEHQINSVIELLDNDFVNQIGDYYIYISEN